MPCGLPFTSRPQTEMLASPLCVLTSYIQSVIMPVMNTKYTFHGIHFEWDSQKASANLHKHGISFETACEVFHDPFVQMVAEEVVDDEVREAVIGMTVDWCLVYVVYVFQKEVVRIISARLVTKAERRRYEEQ